MNHYFAPEFYIFIGSDNYNPGWSGKIGLVQFNSGEGAYRTGKDYYHPKDIFKYKEGLDTLLKPVDSKAPAKPDDKIIDNKSP